MLTYEDMQYFAAFARCGTLTQVAEEYNISQPTITRAMKKAEDVFGVPLFDRTRNSISLNDNGRVAADEIERLLHQSDEMIKHVRSYDRQNRTIMIGTSAAVELPDLIRKVQMAFPEKAITTELRLPEQLLEGLFGGTYQLIILPGKPDDTRLYSKRSSEEHLMFYLPKDHPFAGRKSLHLVDLNGQNMLLFSDIGFWAKIVREKMPDSRFLVQSDRYSFQELMLNSVLPCFVTDLTMNSAERKDDNRVAVPIEDPEVNVTYYLVCKRSEEPSFRKVFA